MLRGPTIYPPLFERRTVCWRVQIVKYTISFSLLLFLCLLSTCFLLAVLFWNTCTFGNLWNMTPCSLVPFWVDSTGVSGTLLPVSESARLHVLYVCNLYGDRFENSNFPSSGIHTARETKFSILIQTNEILLWHWSWTSFSYEYILRTRHFGDWLFSQGCSVGAII